KVIGRSGYWATAGAAPRAASVTSASPAALITFLLITSMSSLSAMLIAMIAPGPRPTSLGLHSGSAVRGTARHYLIYQIYQSGQTVPTTRETTVRNFGRHEAVPAIVWCFAAVAPRRGARAPVAPRTQLP